MFFILKMLKCPSKLCRVCGDKALAFYFNGLTCESCKVFFRRNAPNREKLKCRANGVCKMDFSMRRCCPACRLEKCFSIGMQWKSPVKSSKQNENIGKKLKTDSKPPSQQNDLQLGIIKNPKSQMQLDEYEWGHIEEVKNAISIFKNESDLQVMGEAETTVDAFNLFSNYARKIVKFCKNISPFKQLNQHDQFCVLKPFYFEICAIRNAFYYDAQLDAQPIIANETGSKVLHYTLKRYFEDANNEMAIIGMVNKRFVQGLQARMENDSIIRDLLIGQLLFKPRDGVTCPEFLRYHYYVYCRLLMRYLEVKYQNREQAQRKYESLMNFLSANINELKDSLIQLLNGFHRNQVGQVMIEVFS